MILKPIPGASRYKVSDTGEIYTFNSTSTALNGRPMIPSKGRGPYVQVKIVYDDKKPRSRYIHRLVAEAFLGERPENADIDHINGIKTDNRAENLRYCTRRENQDNKNNSGKNCWQYYASRKVIAKAPDGSEKLYANIKAVCEELHFQENTVSCNIRGIKRNCGMRDGKPHMVAVKHIKGYTFRWADPDFVKENDKNRSNFVTCVKGAKAPIEEEEVEVFDPDVVPE